jgi:uncharacterized protein YfaQ (DUF2300 family)
MPLGGSMCSREMIALLLALASGGGIAETPDCRRQPQREAWLQTQAERWHQRLISQTGYERPAVFTVCHLAQGNPYVDYDRDRIYLRRVSAEEDALSLAHEYLHLAFKHHPLARDERFIEHTARQLLNPDAVESPP